MRLLAIFVMTASLLALAGCAANRSAQTQTEQAEPTERSVTTPAMPKEAPNSTADSSRGAANGTASTIQDGQMKQASLQTAQNSQASVTVTERKLIRNADMTLESSNPAESQRRVSAIAEAHGGFVVTSESKQANAEGQLKPEMTVSVTIRVPAAQFDAAINEIRGAGDRIAQDKISTQDVTEE